LRMPDTLPSLLPSFRGNTLFPLPLGSWATAKAFYSALIRITNESPNIAARLARPRLSFAKSHNRSLHLHFFHLPHTRTIHWHSGTGIFPFSPISLFQVAGLKKAWSQICLNARYDLRLCYSKAGWRLVARQLNHEVRRVSQYSSSLGHAEKACESCNGHVVGNYIVGY
jgi:hypothetical protein